MCYSSLTRLCVCLSFCPSQSSTVPRSFLTPSLLLHLVRCNSLFATCSWSRCKSPILVVKIVHTIILKNTAKSLVVEASLQTKGRIHKLSVWNDGVWAAPSEVQGQSMMMNTFSISDSQFCLQFRTLTFWICESQSACCTDRCWRRRIPLIS